MGPTTTVATPKGAGTAIEGLDELQVRDHLHRGGFDADYDWERLWEKPFDEPAGHPNLR